VYSGRKLTLMLGLGPHDFIPSKFETSGKPTKSTIRHENVSRHFDSFFLQYASPAVSLGGLKLLTLWLQKQFSGLFWTVRLLKRSRNHLVQAAEIWKVGSIWIWI
jgi:hypothetical protein